MALHIADAEVSRLATDLARIEKTTKTEALRRLLREAVNQRQLAAKRKDFRAVALRIATDSRRKNIPPVTKQEMDELWAMDELGGN